MGMELCQGVCWVSCNSCGAETEKIRGHSEATKYAEDNRWRKNQTNGSWKCPLCAAGKEHDVRFDRAGFAVAQRYECFSPFCNHATLVKQPWMSAEVWERKIEEFLRKHPCADVQNAAEWR